MGEIIFLLVLIFVFVMFLFGLFSIGEGQALSLGRTKKRSPSSDSRPNQAATLAMRRAGYEGGSDYVQVTDIGMLAYRHSDEPKLIRFGDVLLDTHFLRPFVELWLPYTARGEVRFEFVDDEGRLRYVDENIYDLEQGSNTLLPDTWLPLQGKAIQPGQWLMRIMAGDALLGEHPFEWQEVGGGRIQRYVGSDGELSSALQQALLTSPREAVSLSDLLSDQEE